MFYQHNKVANSPKASYFQKDVKLDAEKSNLLFSFFDTRMALQH